MVTPRQVAVRVQAVAVDGAVVLLLVDQSVPDHRHSGGVARRGPLLRIEVVPRIDAALPLEPHFPGPRRVQVVLDLEAHVAGEVLGALPDQQVMVGDLEDLVGDRRRGPDALDAGHPAGAPVGAVHAARIELDHAVVVGTASVADARILGIELGDLHALDQALEDVLPFGHQPERAFDDDLVAAVLVAVPVPGGDHHRLSGRTTGSAGAPDAAAPSAAAPAAPTWTNCRRLRSRPVHCALFFTGFFIGCPSPATRVPAFRRRGNGSSNGSRSVSTPGRVRALPSPACRQNPPRRESKPPGPPSPGNSGIRRCSPPVRSAPPPAAG